MIACSYLKKQGYENLVDVKGGFASISKDTSLDILKEK